MFLLWLYIVILILDKSIVVNVFFRDFDSNLYVVGKDVYGNCDLVVYEKGR